MRLLVVAVAVAGAMLLPSVTQAAGPPKPKPIPDFVQTLEKRPGWALCYQKGAPLSFYCSTYPKGAPTAVQMGWWGIAKCSVGIGAFIAGNVVAAYKVKKLGGVWKAAKKIVKAKKGEDRAKAILAVFGELTGVAGVIEACSG